MDLAHEVAAALVHDGHNEADAEQLAAGVVMNWAAGRGKVNPATRARAVAALAHGRRDTVTEQTSAAALLPKGPSPKQSKAITARAHSKGDPNAPHAFRGPDVYHCTLCGLNAGAAIHSARERSEGKRSSDGYPAAAALFLAHGAQIEAQLHTAMTGVFAKQRAATLSRLKGRRGKSMLSGVRSQPPQNPPPNQPPPPTVPPVPAVPLPNVAQIFDADHWRTKTAEAVQPVLDKAGELSVARVRGQLANALQEGTVESGSLAAVGMVLRSRANQMAADVTETTFTAIENELAEGLESGENINALASRVEAVFDQAGRSRAQTIARTEAHGALNSAANAYATHLPVGIVARKVWLAHHDTRTRPTHRVAGASYSAGIPLTEPYLVGDFPMQYPGDPAAPPDEVVNCRCGEAFLPAERSQPVASVPLAQEAA
ncbi:MAG: hypothetical protein JWO62_2620 [Acidimicrobiaceae bacterium]|nr:hypothetical protein [Acidimicrobiaceae bacterium]